MIHHVRLIGTMTLWEGIRNRALLGILAVAVLLCFVFLAIVPMFAFDTTKVAIDLGSASITLSGLAIVIFLGISMLTRDIHQRSACLILSRPISRSDYVVGKFCGLAATIMIAILLISLIAFLTIIIGVRFIPEMRVPRHFSIWFLCITMSYQYLSLLILMAVAFLFTVLTTNEYLSMLFTFCVYIIGHSLETIVKVLIEGQLAQVSTIHLQFLQFFTWIFPNLSAFDLKMPLSYGLVLSAQKILWTGGYGIFYILILLMLTIFFFNRKEIR